MTRDEAITKAHKIKARADGGSTPAERDTARRILEELVKAHGLTADEVKFGLSAEELRRRKNSVDGATFTFNGREINVDEFADAVENLFDAFLRFGASRGARKSRERGGYAPPIFIDHDQAARDHRAHPHRVHMAINDMRAVCGVGPTFVWTYERKVAIASGRPCPHCIQTRIIDARDPQRRLPPEDAQPTGERKPRSPRTPRQR